MSTRAEELASEIETRYRRGNETQEQANKRSLIACKEAAVELRRLAAEVETLRSERTAWRVTAENAEAELAALKDSLGEPVAVIGSDFTLYWAGSGPIAPIVEKHGLKVGSPLFALKETT